MGEAYTELPVPPPLSQRSKRGLIVGALIGGLLFRPVSGALALLGWVAGGVFGAEAFAEGDVDGLEPLYSVETLSFSLLVVLSEFALITALTDLGGLLLDLLLAITAVVTLLIFLWCDSVVKNGYNLLIVFGIFGLLTLAIVPVVVGGSGGSPGETPTETPTATETSTDTGQPSAAAPVGEGSDPNWTFSIGFVDDFNYDYYADRWTLYAPLSGPGQSADTVVQSSNVSRLTVEDRPNGTWVVSRGFGQNRTVVSSWMFVPENATESRRGEGWAAEELHIYDQRNIAELELFRPVDTHRLPSISDSGIGADERRETRSDRGAPTDPDRPATDATESVTVPDWLYLTYGGLFAMGGLLWLRSGR